MFTVLSCQKTQKNFTVWGRHLISTLSSTQDHKEVDWVTLGMKSYLDLAGWSWELWFQPKHLRPLPLQQSFPLHPTCTQPSEIPTSRELGPVFPITNFLLESLENLKENRLSLIPWVSHPVGFTRWEGAGPAPIRESARALTRQQRHKVSASLPHTAGPFLLYSGPDFADITSFLFICLFWNH